MTGDVWVVSWGCLGGVWGVSKGCLGSVWGLLVVSRGVGWCLGGVLDTFTLKMIFDKNDKVLECLIPSLLREVIT